MRTREPPGKRRGRTLGRYNLKLLGRFELRGPEGPIELPNKKLAALLAYLACTSPEPQSREKLATLLWGSHFDAQARQNLRQALFRLRRALGPGALIVDGDEISLATAVVECDAIRLKALSRDGSPASLAAAADLYQDSLLVDVNIAEEAWATWHAAERQRLEGLALDAMIGHAGQALKSGNPEAALKAANRAVAVNALREDAHRLVVQALAGTGRKAEALKHYQDLVARLKRELNAEPDMLTKSLAAELRSAHEVAGPAPPTKPDERSPAAVIRSGASERRQLTIMACHIVDSMALSACLGPEDMRDLVASFHKVVTDVVSGFDGFVAQYLGDGVFVYFGYPSAHEHDPEQAVHAGLAVVAAVRRLKTASGQTVQAGVGIATGPVVVGERLGADGIGQRVAIGETPNLAARLQAAAAPGEVAIAASTHRLIGRLFDCRALGAIEMAGLPQPVEAWQVRGEAAGISRFEARRSRPLSPLVGRQEEIELLRRRWNQAKHGEGRVVLLSGESGIGKSRIAENLLAGLEGEPHVRLRYFCSPHYTNSTLYPVIIQLERAAGFEPGSDAGTRFDGLEALLKPTSKDLSRDAALIAELLGVPADGRYSPLAVSSQQKREMTLTALLAQVDGVAAQGPLLIVVEDAHWIDPTSLDLLDRMVDRAADLPMLLVVTVRPEFEPTWVGQPHVTILPLSRLGRQDSAGIIAGIANGKAMPDAVVEQILARTDGVPLFIEELTTTLIESGLLRETTDHYVLDGPLPTLAVPTTLQASLVSRLDRLGAANDMAQIGAAIGREFSHELIAAVSILAPMDFGAALERLTASGLISRRGTPPDATYTFRHALVQDAAYATMLKSRRRQLHSSIAKVLVEQFPAMAESQPELVAHHFTEAGLAAEAIAYWRRAGQLASARSANLEAVKSFERALHLLEALPESRATLEQRFEIDLQLRTVFNLLGEARAVLERVREAEQLAERLKDDQRRGRACIFLTHIQSRLGDLDEALASGARALEIAERLEDPQLRLAAITYLGLAHHFRGENERVVALATGNLAVLSAESIPEDFGLVSPPSISGRCSLIVSLAELGRFAETAEPEFEAIRLAMLTRKAFSIGWAHLAASWVRLVRGDWTQARPLFEHAREVLSAGNVATLYSASASFSAWGLAQLGEKSEALSQLREGEQLYERQAATGFVGDLGWGYELLGRAALVLGRLDDAQRLADRAVECSPRQPGFAAHALHLLGEVATHPSRLDAQDGEAHYRKALALAKPRGMRPLVAHCHLGLAKLHRRTGTHEKAQEHIATASTLYREMDMPFWLKQAEAEIRQLQTSSILA
jgi:predicted ATPase/class 3 adenylate cyclase